MRQNIERNRLEKAQRMKEILAYYERIHEPRRKKLKRDQNSKEEIDFTR